MDGIFLCLLSEYSSFRKRIQRNEKFAMQQLQQSFGTTVARF